MKGVIITSYRSNMLNTVNHVCNITLKNQLDMYNIKNKPITLIHKELDVDAYLCDISSTSDTDIMARLGHEYDQAYLLFINDNIVTLTSIVDNEIIIGSEIRQVNNTVNNNEIYYSDGSIINAFSLGV